jgi:hypothetical protein
MRHPTAVALFVGMALASHAAQAQLTVLPGVSGRAGDEHIRSRIGMTVQAGAGLTNFTGSRASDATNVGAYGELRTVIGTRTFIGGELAYLGSTRSTSSTSATGWHTSLTGNGGEADVRLQLPMVTSKGILLEPFVLAGIGWTHFSYDTRSLTAPKVSDDVGTIPFGGGLAFGYRGFTADARFTYRPTFGVSDSFVGPLLNGGGLQAWTMGLMVGLEF